MSQPQYGWNMDPPSGSVKRARERAQAGHPPRRPPPPMMMDDASMSPQGQLSPPPRRHMPPSKPPPPLPHHAIPPSGRPRGPAGFDGKGSHIISRPTQAPHWPLPPGSPLTPVNNNENYRPQPGRPQQAPPRPPRPSRIPSLVDQSRPQEPTPVFFNTQDYDDERRESGRDYNSSSTPATPSSRLTTSSVGTIPEFPTPGNVPAPPIPIPPRKSANLGPPPTSRRGASSFYSNASWVSPIPEESSRSHGSYASSAAMPEAWTPASPPTSPYNGDAYYDDSVTEKSRESIGDDFGDESKLVRSASIGKKGKAALVDNKPGPSAAASQARPTATPVQRFEGGTGYMDESTSSSESVSTKKKAPAAPTSAPMDESFLMPIAMQVSPVSPGSPMQESRISPEPSRSPSRLSAIRRPPKLDIDAVREAEARGSITSLPDLIKRATRLAAMIERGKRPASRLDNFGDLLGKSHQDGTADDSSNGRHQSGLSDMLAAFPPPAQPTPNGRQSRGSWFRRTSWPFAPGQGQYDGSTPANDEKPKAQRKCCGMRPWVFVLVTIVILLAIAAAIVIPLQFFVFKTLGNHPEPQSQFDQCSADLDCQNGGTNVVSQGVCSCICTNGFTGPDCGIEGSDGCTTTNLVSSDSSSNIDNVTLGRAIPRLIADASANFSIPLSGTAILAKVNKGDFSCRAQNSLVTFDGRPTRMGEAKSEIVDDNDALDEAAEVNAFVPIKTLTVTDGIDATVTIPHENQGVGMPTQSTSESEETSDSDTTTSMQPRSTESGGGAQSTSEPGSGSDNDFTITEEVLDFARVAVLYIFQEESSSDAEEAQSSLQRFFGAASETRDGFEKATEKDARNVTLSDNNSINLVNFRINIGDGAIGEKSAKRSLLARWIDDLSNIDKVRRGGSVLSKRSGI